MKKNLLIVALIAIVGVTYAQEAQQKYHRAKIYYNSQDDIVRLAEAGIAIDHAQHKKNTFLISDFSDDEILKAKSLGFQTDILIDDVENFYKNQYLNPSTLEESSQRNATCTTGGSGTGIIDYPTPANFDVQASNDFGGFYTYSEILQELDDMRTAYASLITAKDDIKDAGNASILTHENRGIQWVKISNNADTDESATEPGVLYTAIHHAREVPSVQQLIFYMWYLLENYGTDEEVTALLDNTELFFIPVVNPDGYVYNETTNPTGGGNWRKNRRNNGGGSYGVDNNRNYPRLDDSGNVTFGGIGASTSPSSDTYRGPSALSEPENQAVARFIEEHTVINALNAHSSGEWLLFPFGYDFNKPTPDNASYVANSAWMASQNDYEDIISSGLYPAAGDSDDFMYGVTSSVAGGHNHEKVFAMTPEIATSFWPATALIESICKEMMFTNLKAARMAHNYAETTNDSGQFIETLASTADYTIERYGWVGDGNFTVSIEPISSNITSVGSSVSVNSLAFFNTSSGSIAINLNPSTASGETVEYNIVVNNGTFDYKTTVERIYGTMEQEFTDNGDNTTTNWTNTGWGTTTTEFNSSNSSITDSPGGNYSNNENKTIRITNGVDLTNAISANLTFFAKWDIENNWDYVQIEVSIDGGDNWIPQCGNFTNSGSTNSGQPTGEPLYDNTQSSWVEETIDLSDYLDETILIQFQFSSDTAVQADGFYFDDVSINALFNNTLENEEFITQNFNVHPNPVSDILTIQTIVDSYSIIIHNTQGLEILRQENNSGNTEINYSKLSSGVYLMDIQSENGTKTLKVIKQ